MTMSVMRLRGVEAMPPSVLRMRGTVLLMTGAASRCRLRCTG